MRVQIGGQWYPLKLEEIACILPNPRVTPVPKAPPGVAGLVLYQGQVVPIRRAAGNRSGGDAAFAVLYRAEGVALCGVLAEGIDEGPAAEEARLD